MSLSDRLQDTPQRIHGLPCSIGALEDRLDGAERDALDAMLHQLGWSAERIYSALSAEGYEVGRQSINRHRAKSCRCFKAATLQGWTRHGHRIDGVAQVGKPNSVARCGGPSLCSKCGIDAAAARAAE